jgi:DNA-binding transcriptional ArsR family regulator
MALNLRPELLADVVERLKALADENRIRILLRLREGACKVTSLAEELDVAQASVSKHLAVLRQVGLVDVTRTGTTAVYRVKDESVFEMCELVCGGVIRHLQDEQKALAKTLNGNATRAKKRTKS